MFIDYVALMLVNLVIALVLLAVYVAFLIDKDSKRIAPGFLLSGFIGLVTGFGMIFVWPLPGSYNIAFGEPAVLFGALFFFGGLALLRDWDLLSIGIVAVLASIVAVIVGLRLINLKMTQEPVLAGLGFIFTGVGGILTLPTYFFKKSITLRVITTIVILIGAAIWALTGYASYWAHPAQFAKWLPETMRQAAAAAAAAGK